MPAAMHPTPEPHIQAIYVLSSSFRPTTIYSLRLAAVNAAGILRRKTFRSQSKICIVNKNECGFSRIHSVYSTLD
jgi:hypothetical protein